MPPLVTAAAAADVALLAHGTRAGVISSLIACGALIVAFRAAPGAMLAAGLVIAVLLGAGVLIPSAVPGVAQVNGVVASAKQWSKRQTDLSSCAYRQLHGIGPDDAARLGLVERDCSMTSNRGLG